MELHTPKTCELIERVVVEPFIQEVELYLQEHPWNLIRGDRVKGYQKGSVAISLLVTSKKMFVDFNYNHLHSQLTHPDAAASFFPATIAFLRQFAKRKRGILSRAFIVNLLPGEKVLAHFDGGEYYDIRDRYHLVLSSKGSEMLVGGVTSTFVTGDLFYFNNHLTHEAFNNSEEDRIHVIFDILPVTVKGLAQMVLSTVKTGIVYLLKNKFHMHPEHVVLGKQ
jgi:hypothetical protein